MHPLSHDIVLILRVHSDWTAIGKSSRCLRIGRHRREIRDRDAAGVAPKLLGSVAPAFDPGERPSHRRPQNRRALRQQRRAILQCSGLHVWRCGSGSAVRQAAQSSAYNLSGSVFRTVDITERWKFIPRTDCQNIANEVTRGSIQAILNNAAFGTVGSATGNKVSRDFQFSGRIIF
jgi:hypothetical protein